MTAFSAKSPRGRSPRRDVYKRQEQVYQANMLLPAHHLVTFTWGNVSGIDRESGIMAIKPSGVEYDQLSPEDMVLVDIRTGKKVEGRCV